jgi:hypothetical protein
MARYTGERDFVAVLMDGFFGKRIELDTDEGLISFRPASKEGRIISGTTDDNKLVTVDIDDPSNITVT